MLGAKFKEKFVWDVAQFKRRLMSLKWGFLSKASRLTFVKIILPGLPLVGGLECG